MIKAEDLTLGYEDGAVARHVSFNVRKGDYVCILGGNGVGKSTLIKAILNLNAPLKGRVEFDEGLKSDDIGYLPQKNMIQKVFPASVDEVVISGCIGNLGKRFFYSRKDRKKADEALERLNITNLRKACFSELSGGQQQRVLLARALTADGQLLLMDEPVTGLDPHATHSFYNLIDELNRQGITILMVTHDIHPAINSATHILYMDRDSHFYGEKDRFFESENGKAFLKEAGH